MKKLILLASAGLIMASCSVAGPWMVSNNKIGGKRGEAKRKIFLGITFGHTDLSLATAAKNGGITRIATVDWKVKGGLFTKTYYTIVTGE
jgi:hypothetical protein